MHLDDVFDNKFLAYGSSISKKYDTTVSKNGYSEIRNSKVGFPDLNVYVDFGNRSIQDSAILSSFFDKCKGRFHTFNFKNPYNYSTEGVGKPLPYSVKVYEGVYTRNKIEHKAVEKNGKPINIIKKGTILFSIFDSSGQLQEIFTDNYEKRLQELSQDYGVKISDMFLNYDSSNKIFEIKYNEGKIISMGNALSSLGNGGYVTIACEFYNKVRFDNDILTINYNGFDTVDTDEIYLVEVQ